MTTNASTPAAPAGVIYGYARVSTNDQHPEAQAARLAAAGCAREHIYVDKAVSGARARRPRWDALLKVVKAGDTIKATKLDRIARSVKNLFDVAALLDDRGVALVMLDQTIDTSTATGRLFRTVLAGIAEFERDLIIDRTRDGQAIVRRNGGALGVGNLRRSLGGPAPFGLTDPGPADDDHRDWVTDPAAAAMLADLAERLLGGESFAEAFAAQAPATDDTGRRVNRKMARGALARPTSAGLLDAEATTPLIDGPPLDLVTWRRLRARFAGASRGRTPAGRYPLGPLLRCGKCGNQLSGEARKRHTGPAGARVLTEVAYYRCANPHPAEPIGVAEPCRGVSIQAEQIDDALRAAVEGWRATSPAAVAAARNGAVSAERAKLDADLAGHQELLADVLDKAARRGMPRARMLATTAFIEGEIDDTLAALDALDEAEASALPAGLDWDSLGGADKRRLVAEVVQTPIVVAPGIGGGAPLTAEDRLDLAPYREAA